MGGPSRREQSERDALELVLKGSWRDTGLAVRVVSWFEKTRYFRFIDAIEEFSDRYIPRFLRWSVELVFCVPILITVLPIALAERFREWLYPWRIERYRETYWEHIRRFETLEEAMSIAHQVKAVGTWRIRRGKNIIMSDIL